MICAGNWKLNKNPLETRSFLAELKETISEEEQNSFVVFPTTMNLLVAQEMLKNTKINWGGQNSYFEDQGAYTGETSPKMLAEIGSTHCLVGHSERRQLFGETDEGCANKVEALQMRSIVPVLCIGETLEQRESGQTLQVISKQLEVGLSKVNTDLKFWLAYEPVWAIGTGKVATPEQAEEVHAHIRGQLVEKFGEETANGISILYGGSVKPENSKELGAQLNIDGFLVGGASLNVGSFVTIFRNCSDVV